MKKNIQLGIAFDENYVQHFYALFTSILHNNQRNRIIVHAIITGVIKEEQERIKKYAEENGAVINFYEIDETFVKKFVLTSHWSSAAYYRLFFPLVVPKNVSKLLYLDTDIVVVNDLSSLFSINLEHFPVGAVYDNWVKNAPQLGISEEGDYFNSGMMLINVTLWKEERISEKVFDYLAKYPDRINYVDQCGLNAMLIKNWMKLDWKYNVLHSRIPEGMTKKELEEFIKSKVIIHYTLDRPWKMLCRNPYRHLYHKYLNESPFRPKSKYIDYSIKKVPRFLKIKLVEFYFNQVIIKSFWRRIKERFGRKSGYLPI